MLPTKSELEQKGNLDGIKVAMQLDPTATAHLISLLTDLYSDPELAVIREYITNAIDSHIEAGQTRPVEVTTPSGLAFFFKVKDYGIGLSKQDIIDIYSKYGASTKRNTNAQTGMLGLGCKSALTYTHQFNIKSVKDGQEIYIAVSRASDGGGQMEIIAETATDQPNGVEIIVPVNRYNKFQDKTETFLKYCQPGRVLINGNVPERFKGIRITDSIYLTSDNRYNHLSSSKIVMGNVAYPIGSNEGIGNFDWQIIAFVEMGAVDFTPSREQLHMTINTKSTIDRVMKELHANIAPAITAHIANAKTHREALENYMEINKLRLAGVNSNTITYKGSPIETSWPIKSMFNASAWGRSKFQEDLIVSYNQLEANLLVVGYPNDIISNYDRGKIRRYAELNGIGKYLYIVQEKPGSPWTDEITTIDWQDIKDVKFERKSKKETKYEVEWIPNSAIARRYKQSMDEKELKTFSTVYYMSPAEPKEIGYFPRPSLDPDCPLVILSRNKWDKFLKKFPKAEHFAIGIKKTLDDFVASVSAAQQRSMGLNYHVRCLYDMLDVEKVDDPELKDLIRMIKQTPDTKWHQEYKNMRNLAYVSRYPWPFENTIKFDKYPLLRDHNNVDHLYIYLNACYKTLYKEKNEI